MRHLFSHEYADAVSKGKIAFSLEKEESKSETAESMELQEKDEPKEISEKKAESGKGNMVVVTNGNYRIAMSAFFTILANMTLVSSFPWTVVANNVVSVMNPFFVVFAVTITPQPTRNRSVPIDFLFLPIDILSDVEWESDSQKTVTMTIVFPTQTLVSKLALALGKNTFFVRLFIFPVLCIRQHFLSLFTKRMMTFSLLIRRNLTLF